MLFNLKFLLFNKRVEDSIAINPLMVLMTRRIRSNQMISEPLLLNAVSLLIRNHPDCSLIRFVYHIVVFSFNLGYFSFN